MKKQFIFGLFILIFAIQSSGCSVIMAARQPEYKDTNIVKESTPREILIAEFGNPRRTQTNKDGFKEDIFVFKQGYGKGNKFFRVLFHLAGDIFTLFLWELIATPAEMIADGSEVKFKVVYDDKDNIKTYEFYN